MRSWVQKSTLKKLLAEIKPYRVLVIISLVMALICVADTILVPLHIGEGIDIITEHEIDFEELIVVIIWIIGSITVSGTAHWVLNVINNKIVYNVIRDMRKKAFEHIQTLPVSYLDGHSHGEIVSRMIPDIDHLADGLLVGFTETFMGVLTILAMLVVMFVVNPWLALVAVVLTPFSLLVAKFIADKSHKHFENQAASRGAECGYANEIISNEKVVRAYNQEGRVMKKYGEYNEAHRAHSLKAVFFSSLVNPTTRFVNAIIYALIGVIGAVIIVKGGEEALTIGMLTCFLSYASQYAKPFNEISGVIAELKHAFVCADRVYEFLETPGETEPTKPILMKPTEGHVEIKNVSFSYDLDKPLITNFNLDVKPGEHVAIVGRTGCGKTTLINLLMRYYEVKSGEILIDGEPISEMRREEVRSKFGMVLQDTWIRKGTVYDNIRVGAENATDEEVQKAAKAAYADSFIRLLPNGYDTELNENGEGLSEGQKQLLCIARVMLQLPPMLILDEATSSIDTRTEYHIQQGFEKLMEGRTAFIVAHRLSTIVNADRILVMQDGHVVEQGTHKELLASKGAYYELYESQFNGIAV